jgi:uncharacterized membrane protein YtjA (UPF0391 family)
MSRILTFLVMTLVLATLPMAGTAAAEHGGGKNINHAVVVYYVHG